jgi:putative ABC transport system permease protein
MATSQPVSSVVTGLIVGAVCGVILSTTGQTVQAEQQVLSRIDEAGTRSVTITDTNGAAGIRPDAVSRISRISGVEWVIGLGPAQDVRAAGIPAGNPTAVRALYGNLPDVITSDRWDQNSGTVLIGPVAQRTLGLEVPAGGVTTGDGADLAVVGGFIAGDPLGFLNRSALTVADPAGPDPVVRSIHILAVSPEDVAKTAEAALLMLDAADPTSIGVETSATLAGIRAAVQGELGEYGRQLVTLILAVGLILVALNLYGSVTVRRRDFGRRRALGASRTTIITLITTQTMVVALIGATLGTLIGGALVWRWTNTPPDLPFSVAIATLAILTAALAAIPPALIAAYRDPVRILRVP